jgi:ATP-dependent DNA ligase
MPISASSAYRPRSTGRRQSSRTTGGCDFDALLTKRGWLVAAFVAFDLSRGGDDLRQRSQEKRPPAFARLIAERRGDGILFSEALVEEGAVVFAKACQLGLKGIVSKRAESFYKSGPSRNWLKNEEPAFR